METKKQYKIYLLKLNDMRSSKIEITSIFGFAFDKQTLVDFYNREKVETYFDGKWAKSFKKGGPLEWANQVNLGQDIAEETNDKDGIKTEWIDKKYMELGKKHKLLIKTKGVVGL